MCKKMTVQEASYELYMCISQAGLGTFVSVGEGLNEIHLYFFHKVYNRRLNRMVKYRGYPIVKHYLNGYPKAH